MSECKCTFAQRMVGDGCDVCNPDLAAECDLDAAWEWFRESGYSLREVEGVYGGIVEWLAYEYHGKAALGSTRDGAVIAAWRAATKEGGAK